MVTVDEVVVADAPGAWEALGFAVDGDVCVLGGVRVRLAGTGAGRGIVGWSLRGVALTELDGLPTTIAKRSSGSQDSDAPERESPSAPAPPAATESHPNGLTAIDHVVAIAPDLDRAVAALQAAGLELRRVREQPTPAGAPRQAFFRLGGTILELVQEPPEAVERGGGADRPAFFWGLALLAPELEATAARLGERCGEVRDAVQPGRRIATLRRSAGLSVPVALIAPAPPG